MKTAFKFYSSTSHRLTFLKMFVLSFIFTLTSKFAYAQDPRLPPTNLGLANMYDGIAGKPGFVYVSYVQVYETKQINNAQGNNTYSDLKINSLLSMHQFIYLTPIKLLAGNLGFTVLIPVVKISASEKNGNAPSANPSVLGDIVGGTAIQWSDKKLFGKPFSHRVEFNISVPLGSYSQQYAINPSAHLFSMGVYHAFTMIINKKISLSSRNQFTYNSHILDAKDKPGAFYTGNYSIEYAVLENLHVEAAAYYMAQLNQDSYDGDSHYYMNQYNISNTKESVAGFGPGVIYTGRAGLMIEAKVFFETAAKNTTQGIRPTLRLAIPF